MQTTEMLKIQFEDGWQMLKQFVEICPDDLWCAENHGLPLWNHVMHTMMGTAFWLRTDYRAEFQFDLTLPANCAEILLRDEWCTSADGCMTKTEVQACFDVIDARLSAFWAHLDDGMLNQKIREDFSFTYLSVIVAQIRHVMCHVGMCNAALHEHGIAEVPWVAYGET